MSSAQGPQTLEEITRAVVSILVDTFGFDQADAEHRITLWKANQHRLEGEALEAMLPLMTPDQASAEMLRHVLAGQELADKLEQGRELYE